MAVAVSIKEGGKEEGGGRRGLTKSWRPTRYRDQCWIGELASEGLFVFEHQALVAHVEVNFAQRTAPHASPLERRVRGNPDGPAKVKRIGQAVYNNFEFASGRRQKMALKSVSCDWSGQ